KVHNISNHLDLNIKEFAALSFSGNSTVTNLIAQNIKFLPMTVTHIGQASLPEMTMSSQHEISLEQGFMVDIEQRETKVEVQIEQQNIQTLKKIMSQLENRLILKQGNLSASIDFTLPQKGEQFIAQGNAYFQEISAKYKDYKLNNMTYLTPLTFDSAGLQLAESTVHIDSIDAGVPIEKLEALVIVKDSVFRLKKIHGEIFNGQFSSSQLWLDRREQEFDIKFENIDLAQIVALQQQPGIKITGNIEGDLPMMMNQQGISIDEGWASSLSGGTLTIVDNPSFDSIKVQQPQLALLENIDFTQLQSNVRLTPDGWMFFDIALKGSNPVKKQSVNFNYTHQENIFSLLESIRLVNSIKNKIEQKTTQGGEK
ncbi:MAG: YdbH domain-containing protein, partial [Sinobacterium sp.]